MDNNENLTTTQVAELLHVSTQTIRDWTSAGKLPATTTRGGHRRYTLKDVYLCLHHEQGNNRYWTDDACIIMDHTGKTETRWSNDPHDKYNNKPIGTASAQLLTDLANHGYQINLDKNDIHIEGDMVTIYLQVKALTKEAARTTLANNIETATNLLKQNVKPAPSIAWQTTDGKPITTW